MGVVVGLDGRPYQPHRLDTDRLYALEEALRAVVADHGYRVDSFEVRADMGSVRGADWPTVALCLTQLPAVGATAQAFAGAAREVGRGAA